MQIITLLFARFNMPDTCCKLVIPKVQCKDFFSFINDNYASPGEKKFLPSVGVKLNGMIQSRSFRMIIDEGKFY